MPKQVQHRRGTTAQHAAFTGAIGEITVDTDKKTAVVHDGSTAGGHPLARAADSLSRTGNLSELSDKGASRAALSVFSRDESLGIGQTRRPGAGIYFQGLITTQRLYAALGSYSIGTNPFTLRLVFRVPSANTAVRTVALISSANNAIAANGFAVLLSSGSLQVRKYGATTNDYVFADYTNFVAEFGGKLVELVLVRSLTALSVYVNGIALALGAPATAGAGAGWLDAITSNYLLVGSGIGSSYLGEFYGATVFNYPLSAGQVDSLCRDGIAAADLWSDDVEMILASADRTFSGANNWANVSMTGYDEIGDLSLSANAGGQKASLGASYLTPPATARRYQLACDVNNLTGTTFTWNRRGSIVDDLTPVPIGNVTANGRFYATFVLDTGTLFGDLQVLSNGAGSVDLDNVTLKPAGAVLDWDFGCALGYQVPDRSGNGFHALGVQSPVFLNAPRRGQVRGRTSTNGNQQLLGATCLPLNARLTGIVVNSSGTPTVSVGTASGGAQIVNGAVLAAGRNEPALVTRLPGSGNVWVSSNSTATLDWTILYEIID